MQAILRICYLRKFGYFSAKMKSVRFSFDKDKGMFFGPLQMQFQLDEQDAQEKMVRILLIGKFGLYYCRKCENLIWYSTKNDNEMIMATRYMPFSLQVIYLHTVAICSNLLSLLLTA